jgi:hypothetical protein
MLKFPQKKTKWFGKAQSGFYVDFFLKKLSDLFIRNVFIFSAMFFGEKYMIEKITRKIVDSFLFKSNKFLGFSVLNYRFFIYNLLIFIIYILIFLNLFLIILY